MKLSNQLAVLVLAALACHAAPAESIRVSEGTLTLPTYEHSTRETAPALFGNSTVTGLYPFTAYLHPFRQDSPTPRDYQAIFIENEYLKITYLPEFGGRLFSLFDKVRSRDVFYRNDVIKPANYNPKDGFPLFGIELTGPHDLHSMTLRGEPFWSNKVVRNEDGSVSLVLGELDPVYHMKVNLIATLHPGIAALQMSVFCYNRRDGRMPQMFWISGSLAATEKTRFIYPMSRTIGHTTAEIADWPVFNGIDYSWDRNNKHMLGVFGIDTYDNFQGAYHFDLDYGVFRYADRRIVQGMKLWTFGYSDSATALEHAYTDHAGPYIEVQSGRHVWDGHYEYVGPHKAEQWSEWWLPVSGIGGLTTTTRDVALNLEVQDHGVRVRLAAMRVLNGASVIVTAGGAQLLSTRADLAPGQPFDARVTAAQTKDLVVQVTDAAGHELMAYHHPDSDPGRKEYTYFTAPLEKPRKSPEQMSAEELVVAAESKLKELNYSVAEELLNQSLARDPGFSRAHLQLGIYHFTAGRYESAITHLQKAIERDPYLDEAYYYLAMSQFVRGDDQHAERNLYYIWPQSAYFGEREFHLGRLAFLGKNLDSAVSHLERAIMANGYDMNSRLLLAMTWREQNDAPNALKQLAEIERIDSSDRFAAAEHYFLTGDPGGKAELLRLTGGQSQEALDLAIFYEKLRKWKDAAQILEIVEHDNRDPWGTTPEFYYTLAYCLQKDGDAARATEYLKKARTASGNMDRFPYREESEAPLAAAVEADPKDTVARFNLACLLYYHERPAEAIRQWEAAVEAGPRDFQSHRALGLAYAEQGYPVEKAAAQLEAATQLNPAHVRTFNDLSALYARAGRFDEQFALLTKAFERSPKDDDLAEALIAAYLVKGRYQDAEKLIATHEFEPRHRSYGLRDKYRAMRYGMGAAAFNQGRYAEALALFESSMKPPVSLGVDTFQFQSTPRLQYFLGRTLDALGRQAEARRAYEKGIEGVEQLSGDRDSWNSENFYMVLSLERLGRKAEASQLTKHFVDFAETEMDSTRPNHRAEARYLLGLAKKNAGETQAARRLMQDAVKAQPELLVPRYELSGDVLDPLP
jgi:tetratricopeptide (TPR) repeat protein